MCSIGHHDASELPVKRRRLDGSVSAAVKALPRTELQRRRAEVVASLAHYKATRDLPEEPPAIEPEQFDLLPPGLDQLPDYMVRQRLGELPPPESFWWSGANER